MAASLPILPARARRTDWPSGPTTVARWETRCWVRPEAASNCAPPQRVSASIRSLSTPATLPPDVACNINTSAAYLINGQVAVNTTSTQNTAAGVLAGTNGGGGNVSSFGFRAGFANLTGDNNSFFGSFAGTTNQSGTNNSF